MLQSQWYFHYIANDFVITITIALTTMSVILQLLRHKNMENYLISFCHFYDKYWGAVLFLKLSLLHVSVFEQNSFGFLCLNNTLLVCGPLTWGPCCVSVRDPFDPSLSYLVFAFYALPPCFIADCPIQLICVCVFAYLYFYLYVDPLSVIFSFCLFCFSSLLRYHVLFASKRYQTENT